MKSGTGQSLPLLLPKDPARARSGHETPLPPGAFPQQRPRLDFALLLLWVLNLNLLEQGLVNKCRSQQRWKGNTLWCAASCRFVGFLSQTNCQGLKQLPSPVSNLSLPSLAGASSRREIGTSSDECASAGSKTSSGCSRLAGHPGHFPPHSLWVCYLQGNTKHLPASAKFLLNSS